MVDSINMYEYRGAISCELCFDTSIIKRDYERAEVIEEHRHKTDMFKGLDIAGDNSIGRGNREILKRQIEISKKESIRTKSYEGNQPNREYV